MELGIRTRTAGALSYRSANFASDPAPLPGVAKPPAALAGSALDTGDDYPEIDCIRSLLPIDVLMAAQERAACIALYLGKTTHGLAKSSRRADQTTRALLELERHLRNLMASGNLPTLPAEMTVKRPVRVYHMAQRAS
jgi:hypothetical protein